MRKNTPTKMELNNKNNERGITDSERKMYDMKMYKMQIIQILEKDHQIKFSNILTIGREDWCAT